MFRDLVYFAVPFGYVAITQIRVALLSYLAGEHCVIVLLLFGWVMLDILQSSKPP